MGGRSNCSRTAYHHRGRSALVAGLMAGCCCREASSLLCLDVTLWARGRLVACCPPWSKCEPPTFERQKICDRRQQRWFCWTAVSLTDREPGVRRCEGNTPGETEEMATNETCSNCFVFSVFSQERYRRMGGRSHVNPSLKWNTRPAGTGLCSLLSFHRLEIPFTSIELTEMLKCYHAPAPPHPPTTTTSTTVSLLSSSPEAFRMTRRAGGTLWPSCMGRPSRCWRWITPSWSSWRSARPHTTTVGVSPAQTLTGDQRSTD